jgi:membrane protein
MTELALQARRISRRIYGSADWLLDVAVQALKRFVRHRGETLGASLAFKTLLAVAPLLVVAVAVLAQIIGAGRARAETLATVNSTLGPKAVEIVADWLDTARSMSSIATAVGTLLFVYGASRFVDGVDATLETVFEEPTVAPPAPLPWKMEILHELRDRAVHLAVTLGLMVWIAASLAARVAMATWWPSALSHVLELAQVLFSFVSLVFALAVMYRVLPQRRLAWSDVLLGATVTAVLQLGGAWMLEQWFTRVQVGTGYGATGTVVAILVFLYFTAQVFVLGAELSAEVLRRRWARVMRREGGV